MRFLILFPVAAILLCGTSTFPSAVLKEHAQPLLADTVWAKFHASIPEDMEYRVFLAYKDRRAGWMNALGEWVIPPEYDVSNGSHGLATNEWHDQFLICTKGGKTGVVNIRNQVIIPFEYDRVSYWATGFVTRSDDMSVIDHFDLEGNRIQKIVDPFDANVQDPKGWRSEEGPFRGLSTNVEDHGMISPPKGYGVAYASRVSTHDLEIFDIDGTSILKFEQVPFMVQFFPAYKGYRRFSISPFVQANADLGNGYGLYGFLDTVGNVIIPPRFSVRSTRLASHSNWADDRTFEISNGMVIVVQDSSYCYLDLQGSEVFRLPMLSEHAVATPFNCCGIAAYHVYDMRGGCRIRFIDRTGKEVLTLNKGNMGIQGNSWTQPPDDLIPLVDMERHELRLFSPAMEQFGTLPLGDAPQEGFSYKGFVGEKPGHLELFCKADHMGDTGCYGQRGYQRIVDENNHALSSWFPACALLDRTYGLYADFDERTFTQRVYDLSGRMICQLDSMVLQSYQRMASHGLFEFYNPVSHKEVLMNFQGKLLSDSCKGWGQNAVQLKPSAGATVPPRDIVKVKFTEADVVRWYNASGLDKLVKR